MASIRCNAFVPSLPLTSSRSSLSGTGISARARGHQIAGRWQCSVVLAPGQGAQVVGMGRSWRDRSARAAQLFKSADDLLGDQLGAPLSSLIDSDAEDAGSVLGRTDIAQPAIFVTSLACWAGMQETGVASIDSLRATAGLSLGEYTALVISGAMSFEDGLRLVALRGRAMQDAAEQSDGGMVALIGASDEAAQQVVDACSSGEEGQVLVAANFNAPGQVVLSGSTALVDKAAEYAADSLKLRVAKLDVAGAFHSPLMQPAADRLKQALDETQVIAPRVPVMSNVTALPHDVDSIRPLLVQQLTNPVRWAKCCEYLKNNEEFAAAEWMELAPGKTLSGIMRKIDRKRKVTNMAEAPVQV